jgi:hypothetical protein
VGLASKLKVLNSFRLCKNLSDCSGSDNAQQETRTAPRLLVFGNALLDVTVQMDDNDDELLKKYKLERNGQAEVPLDKLNSLFNEARDR